MDQGDHGLDFIRKSRDFYPGPPDPDPVPVPEKILYDFIMAVLFIEKGKQQGLQFEVLDDAEPMILGRDQSVDVVIHDERASRRHAKLFRCKGEWVVEDLGSRNGILFQRGMVRRFELKDGEKFQIGSTVLILKENDRVDPLAGMEVEGSRLLQLLSEEGGVLRYQALQLAMDRPMRVDILHSRRPLISPDAGQEGYPQGLILALESAARAALQIDHPRVNPLQRAEIPDVRGGGIAMLRWNEAPTLAEILSDFLRQPLEVRLRWFLALAEGVLARAAEPLCYPIGLRHIQMDPEEGPMVQALELSALLALLKGHAADLPAFPDYLAPEQASGRDPSRPALIYNLGALGYHLLTGSTPMGEGRAAEVLERHETLPPAPADLVHRDIPAKISKLLAGMLEKDPSLRPSSAGEILEIIRSCSGPVADSGSPPPFRKEGRPVPGKPAVSGKPVVPGAGTRPVPGPGAAARPASRPVQVAPVSPAVQGARRRAPGSAPAMEDRRIPLPARMIFWLALWSALFLGGRYLILLVLEKMAEQQ